MAKIPQKLPCFLFIILSPKMHSACETNWSLEMISSHTTGPCTLQTCLDDFKREFFFRDQTVHHSLNIWSVSKRSKTFERNIIKQQKYTFDDSNIDEVDIISKFHHVMPYITHYSYKKNSSRDMTKAKFSWKQFSNQCPVQGVFNHLHFNSSNTN